MIPHLPRINCRTFSGAADMDQPQDNHPRPLTAEELDALRRDMRDASMWVRAELRRRAECRRNAGKVS